MTATPQRRLRAGWLFPVAEPPIRDGLIVWQGDRIQAVDTYRGEAVDEHWPEAAVVPGLVNAHTHLDLTHLAGHCPPTGDFPAWLEQVIQGRRSSSPAETEAGIQAGIAASLAAGVTLLGDIDGGGDSVRWLAHQPLHAVVFREIIGLPTVNADRSRSQAEEWLLQPTPPNLRRGLSPHAPYSVHRALWEWAARQAIPVATHLAETFDELTLLADRTGPFAEFLERLNVWSPAALLASVEEPLHWTSTPWLIAHANYFPRSAWPTLSRHHVVYCPRTHAVFGHTPHPFAEMLESGLNVALGTDSLASNPDLDLWQEVHHVWQHWPASLPPARLLAMATRHGALALGDAARGQLAPGTPADFVIVPLPADRSTADPHEGLYAASGAGRRVVQAGSFRN